MLLDPRVGEVEGDREVQAERSRLLLGRDPFIVPPVSSKTALYANPVIRQLWINQTLKAQLDLERHGGRTTTGIVARVWQRMLALTAAIWHNQNTRQPVLRSLTAYDH